MKLSDFKHHVRDLQVVSLLPFCKGLAYPLSWVRVKWVNKVHTWNWYFQFTFPWLSELALNKQDFSFQGVTVINSVAFCAPWHFIVLPQIDCLNIKLYPIFKVEREIKDAIVGTQHSSFVDSSRHERTAASHLLAFFYIFAISRTDIKSNLSPRCGKRRKILIEKKKDVKV